MQLNHLKLGLFYVSTVIAVVILFSAVTRYGESSLKGAVTIQGVYALQNWQSTASLPSCLGQTRASWFLVLHQSGIFVNASFVKPTADMDQPGQGIGAAIREPTTLIGRVDNSTIALNGKLTNLATCETTSTSTVNLPSATLHATLNRHNLDGTLELDTIPGVIQFQGILQASPLSSDHLVGEAH